jgi:hypothetical protein
VSLLRRLEGRTRDRRACSPRIASSPSIRYFGPDRAAANVSNMIERVRERDAVPGELELGGRFDVQAVLDVLEHLLRYWDLTPPVVRASASPPSCVSTSCTTSAPS